MIVTDTTYDQARAGMIEQTTTALAWQFLRAPGELFPLPVVLLGEEASWLANVSADDLAAADIDWRFLAPPTPAPDRPALIRLDLLFPDQRRLAVLWEVVTSAAFLGLSFVAVGDRLALTYRPDAVRGVAVSGLGLGQLEGFKEIGALVGAPLALGDL